jgi:hypothetical protein
MVTIQVPKRNGQLPGLSLSLSEQAAHISRGLEADLMGQIARIDRGGLRSTLS